MKSRKWALLAISVAVLIILAGCGGNSNSDKPANSNDGGTVAAADAEKLYKANCVSCHGADLKGQNLNTVGARLSHDEIAEKIRKGGGGMIAFEKRLDAAEITALSDWLAEKK
jgi:cytochrome c551